MDPQNVKPGRGIHVSGHIVGETKCPHCGEFQDYSQERDRVTCENCGKRFKPSFSTLRRGGRGAYGRG